MPVPKPAKLTKRKPLKENRKSPKQLLPIPVSPTIARKQAKIQGMTRPDFMRNEIRAGGLGQTLPPNMKSKTLNQATLLRIEDPAKSIVLPQGYDEIVFELLGNIGFSSSVLIEMLWLLRIHKNACLISSEFQKTGRNRFDTITVDWICSQDKLLTQLSMAFKSKDKISTRSKNRTLKVPKGFQASFMRCVNNPSIRFIVIPVKFVHLECKDGINAATAQAHAGMILFDKKTQTMERFEPFGFLDIYDNNEFDIEFANWIINAPENQQLPIKHYLGATEICPREGFQYFQEQTQHGNLSGKDEAQFFDLLAMNDSFFKNVSMQSSRGNLITNFCSIWSNWYANLRMSNPSFAPATVIEKSIGLLKADPRGMSAFILRYTTFVRSEALKIFREIGIEVDIRKNFVEQFDNNEKLDSIIAKIEDELESRIMQA